MDLDRYRVAPGTDISLEDWDPDDDGPGSRTKEQGQKAAEKSGERLGELQELLFAGAQHKVLIVLQGMDTSGKDGTIKHVFGHTNAAGVDVASFKKPTETELAHDYLWRVHAQVPEAGRMTIFNRSHYEDVLVVRVDELVPEAQWRRRYRHIREFERMLAEEGTLVRKFFLHISKDEQRDRLQARLDDPTKTWKFQEGDLGVRERWDDYQRAYAEALGETSTDEAPWYVVPANHKWYRNLVVASVLIEALDGLDLRYPRPAPGLTDLEID
jgi:PPK2 family polyphosphate:nucleotide phosphotransferase